MTKARQTAATDKQISYAISLVRKAGLSTDWMDASWKGYATMKQRSGRVSDFLADMSKSDISNLIDNLKG